MSEWKQVSLTDIVEIIGGGTPKTSVSEYWNGDIFWLSVKDFNNDKRYVYETEKRITTAGLNNSSTTMLQKDDIIISARGTVGEMAMIPFPMAFNQSCYGIRAKNNVDKTFLYYLIKNSIYKLKAMTHGSVFDTITRDTFASINVSLPGIERQQNIASILSVFDDKIELNNKVNKNLFKQLAVLYNQMTISADNVNPVKLGSLCSFQEGYVNPAQTHPEYFGGTVKWLRAVDINESYIIETSRTLTIVGFESAKKSALLFEPNTIVISKSGTIGRLGIIDDYMCGNRAVINIKPFNPKMLPFIYLYLKSRQHEFPDLAVGSVQKNLYVSLLEPLIVNMPSNAATSTIFEVSNAMLGCIRNNCSEIIRLKQLRDALLPKLMSGELGVSDLNL